MEKLFPEDKYSRDVWNRSVGKMISSIILESLGDDSLRFTFTDGTKIRLYDGGQDCCEIRYMRTDDDLSDYFGATLISAEIRYAPKELDENGDDHEVQFLLVHTSKGTFTIASHNEHNGYYGGFYIQAADE